tara:strand:+ start:219 stop:476 length:258 start_codon:yes stop_codon:yes gene_type:complete
MNINLLDKMTRKFLLGEEKEMPTIRSCADSIQELLNKMKPQSMRESKQINTAKERLSEIKKLARKLEGQVLQLEEQIELLEEGKK